MKDFYPGCDSKCDKNCEPDPKYCTSCLCVKCIRHTCAPYKPQSIPVTDMEMD